jgi:alkylated DNA repair dioxygenase AlkB
VYAGLNGILNNYYEGPDEYIGHHRDSIANMVEDAPILTLSFGESKTFRMTRREGGVVLEKYDLEVSNGSIVLIPYRTNRLWHHEVPKSARRSGKRISVTMRAFI